MDSIWQVFNWFDVTVVILILLYVWQGWDRGVAINTAELASWFVAWLSGVYFAEKLATFLVTNFGLWPQSSWLWAFMVLVVISQQVVYRVLMNAFLLVARHYLSSFWQFLIGITESLMTGMMVIFFLVLLLVKIPVHYPLERDTEGSWFGQMVATQLGELHKIVVGNPMNMGLQ